MSRFPNLLPAVLLCFIPFAAYSQTVSGTVRDAQTGTPLPSMVAAAYNAAGALQANATTDATGRYTLSVPAGEYRVLAYDPAGIYATEFSGNAPSFEECPVTTVSSGQTAGVDFQLQRGGTVTGNVLTSGGAQPNLTVAAYNLSGTRRGFTTADPSGNYSIVLPPGTYRLAAYDDAGAFAPSFFRDRHTFAGADNVTVNASASMSNVNFFLPLGARLSGIVTNLSGVAIGGAIVIAYNGAGVQITFAIAASSGAFSMTVPPGTYRLVAVDPAYVYAAGYLNGANSFATSPALAMNGGQAANDLTFRLEPGGQIAGTVLDSAAGGAPIRNITAAAYNNDGTERTFVTTDANGRFVLLLPSGTFRIAAYDNNLVYATEFHEDSSNFAEATAISASPGQVVTLDPFMLSHGGRFKGTVTDQDQFNHPPIAGAVVAAYDEQGNLTANATTATDGSYRLVVLAGSYRLISYDPQLRYASGYAGGAVSFKMITPSAVIADGETPVSFALHRGTLVSGSIADLSHAGVRDVEVTALDLDENAIAMAVSGADGSFQLALAPGNYKFGAFDPNGRYAPSYFGGSAFSNAATVTVGGVSPPRLSITVRPPTKRRSAHH